MAIADGRASPTAVTPARTNGPAALPASEHTRQIAEEHRSPARAAPDPPRCVITSPELIPLPTPITTADRDRVSRRSRPAAAGGQAMPEDDHRRHRHPDPAVSGPSPCRPGRTAACRRRRRCRRSREIAAGDSPRSCPTAAARPAGTPRTALTTSTPTPRVAKTVPLLGEHRSPKAGRLGRDRPRGPVVSVRSRTNASMPGRRPAAATMLHRVGAPQAGQVNHRPTEERPDEQPDPVHPAERRHRPGPQPERHHLGDVGLPGQLPHGGAHAGDEDRRGEHRTAMGRDHARPEGQHRHRRARRSSSGRSPNRLAPWRRPGCRR